MESPKEKMENGTVTISLQLYEYLKGCETEVLDLRKKKSEPKGGTMGCPIGQVGLSQENSVSIVEALLWKNNKANARIASLEAYLWSLEKMSCREFKNWRKFYLGV